MYAIAHVRGGGDLGAYWHADGMLMNKRNTFTDFITCAKHLIQVHTCVTWYLRPCIHAVSALTPVRSLFVQV